VCTRPPVAGGAVRRGSVRDSARPLRQARTGRAPSPATLRRTHHRSTALATARCPRHSIINNNNNIIIINGTSTRTAGFPSWTGALPGIIGADDFEQRQRGLGRGERKRRGGALHTEDAQLFTAHSLPLRAEVPSVTSSIPTHTHTHHSDSQFSLPPPRRTHLPLRIPALHTTPRKGHHPTYTARFVPNFPRPLFFPTPNSPPRSLLPPSLPRLRPGFCTYLQSLSASRHRCQISFVPIALQPKYV